MKGIPAYVLIMFVFCGRFAFAAEPAQVEIKLATDGAIWQGQRVVIRTTIKSPDTFANVPAFDLPQVTGAILVPPSGSPVLGTETIGDDSFTTQTHDLLVFPQQVGTITIPSFTIRFSSSVGFGKPVQSQIVKTTPVSFSVKKPPGTEHLAMVLTTTNLSVHETWEPQPGKEPVAVGTAFKRTIQTTAGDLPGIVLPTFQIQPPAGLRVYKQEPILNDEDNRGDLTGKRSDSATFVCEQSGTYELPAMTVTWWNPTEQVLHHATLPARTIKVAAPSTTELTKQPTPSAASSAWTAARLISATILVGVICAVVWFWPTLTGFWNAHQAVVAESEPHYFQVIVKACHSGDAKVTYQAILAWREKLDLEHGFSSDAALVSELRLLEVQLFGSPASTGVRSWSPEQLLTCVTQFRRHRQRERALILRHDELPAINPTQLTK